MVTFSRGSLRSPDGNQIGYLRAGAGPAIVLVHGGLLTAQHFVPLATELASSFTVFVPDRRGRGLSGPYRDDGRQIVDQEAGDLRALLRETAAEQLFGLSSGALVCLNAVLGTSSVHKLAVFEPPLSIDGSTPTEWLTRYERELAAGKTAAALVTGMRGLRVDPIMSRMPRAATPLLQLVLNLQRPDHHEIAMRDLVPTWRYDLAIIHETADEPERYRAIDGDVLLLAGARSPAYLGRSLDALQAVLPRRHRRTLPHVGHQAPVDQPSTIAAVLRDFFQGRVRPSAAQL